MFAKRAYLVIC
jgi:hypothetical protein